MRGAGRRASSGHLRPAEPAIVADDLKPFKFRGVCANVTKCYCRLRTSKGGGNAACPWSADESESCSSPCFLLIAVNPLGATTGESVAPAFRGEWVPGPAACASPVKLVLDANVVAFVNGAQRAEYRKLEQCFSCMGRDVQNVTLLSTDAMGDSPFMIYLDGSKKQPVVTVDFSNDRRLGARFPLGIAALKKCS